MKKYYIAFSCLGLLYVAIVILSFIVSIEQLFLSICSILVWAMLAVIAIKQMVIIEKNNRVFKHYFFVVISLMVLLLTIFRIIIK